MNNKPFFLLLSVLAAGILLGYAGDYLLSEDKKETTVPRSSSTGKFTSQQKNIPVENTSPQGTLDEKIREYARMNTDEIGKELQRWNDKITTPDMLHSRDRFLMEYLCLRWGRETPKQALLKLQDMPHLGETALLSMMKGWAEKNPESLTTYCLEQGGQDNLPDNVARFCTYTLASLSPENSVAWMKTLPEGKREQQIHHLMAAIREKYPNKISSVVALLGEEAMKSREMSAAIASTWAEVNWETAAAWINSLPEETKTFAWSDVVKSMPADEALKHLDSFDEKTQNGILGQKTYALFFDSPQKAIDWLTAHTTPERAAQIIEEKTPFNREKTYTPEFNATLDKLPAGPMKDSLLDKVVTLRLYAATDNNFRNNKMEDNMTLALSIIDAQKRADVIERSMRYWVIEHNAESARKWLEQSTLPQEKKEQYLNWCKIQLGNKEG